MDNNSSSSPTGSPPDCGGYSDDDMEDDYENEEIYQGEGGAGPSDGTGFASADGPGMGISAGGAIRRHRRKQQAGQHLICTICGDDACGYNFDALTCHSCKLFFRRNAFRTLSCPFNKACQIDKVRRKFCAACRLAKCFDAGMKREFIKVAPAGVGGGNSNSGSREPRKSPKVEPSGPSSASGSTHVAAAAGASMPNQQFHPDAINQMVSAMSVKAEPSDADYLRQMPPGMANMQMVPGAGKMFPPSSMPPGVDVYSMSQAGMNLGGMQQQQQLQQQMPAVIRQQSAVGPPKVNAVGPGASAPQMPFGGQMPFGVAPGEGQMPFGVAPGEGQMPPFGLPPGDGQMPFGLPSDGQLPFGLTMDQIRMAFGAAGSNARADGMGGPNSEEPIGHVSSFSQPDSPSSTSVASSNPTVMRPIYNPLEETIDLTEFDYDRLLMVCSSGWKTAVSPVNAAEFEEAVVKSQQNPQMSILSAISRSLFQYLNYIEFGVRKTVAAFKQVPDFREMPQTVQMKLLKAATLSVLNVSAVFVFDAEKQQWVIRTSDGEERWISMRDIVPMLEKFGHAEIIEYMMQYTRFHTELRHVFADDNVVLFAIVLLDLFAPSRFNPHDSEMVTLLNPIHAKYSVFLKRYIKRHYKAVFSASGAAISAMPRLGQNTTRQMNPDDYGADDDIESASVISDPNCPRSESDADASSSSSHSLVSFVFEKLNDHARSLEAYLMRLSARLLVNGSALSPLLREVLQIAQNAFEYQLNQPDSN